MVNINIPERKPRRGQNRGVGNIPLLTQVAWTRIPYNG